MLLFQRQQIPNWTKKRRKIKPILVIPAQRRWSQTVMKTLAKNVRITQEEYWIRPQMTASYIVCHFKNIVWPFQSNSPWCFAQGFAPNVISHYIGCFKNLYKNLCILKTTLVMQCCCSDTFKIGFVFMHLYNVNKS